MFSVGATYSEESEAPYISTMLHHDSSHIERQPFSFGTYLTGQVFWKHGLPVSSDKPVPTVLWLHPYSYNTGYSPSYQQSNVVEDLANAGFLVMAFDQVGFGIRNTQGGARFYARHCGDRSLLGRMVQDAKAAIDFLYCRSDQRHNQVGLSECQDLLLIDVCTEPLQPPRRWWS